MGGGEGGGRRDIHKRKCILLVCTLLLLSLFVSLLWLFCVVAAVVFVFEYECLRTSSRFFLFCFSLMLYCFNRLLPLLLLFFLWYEHDVVKHRTEGLQSNADWTTQKS